MNRYEDGQNEGLMPLSRDKFIHNSTTFSQKENHFHEENNILNAVGQDGYELHVFSSLEGLASAQSTCESTKPSHAPLLPANGDSEGYENTDIHPRREHAPGSVKEQKFTWIFNGWRVGVTSNACIATMVLIQNIILTIWASLSFPMEGGFGTLIQGDCSKVTSWALWLHLAINVLSTLLLGASNYTMQCLLAPTRREADKAHKKGKGVYIGFGAFYNLRYISWNRAIIYALLVISSMPLHLLYNSAIFKTLTARQYSIFVVNESFLRGAAYNNDLYILTWINGGYENLSTLGYEPSEGLILSATLGQSAITELQQNVTALQNLSISECITAYNTGFITDRGSLLAITNATYLESRLVTAQMGATPNGSVYGWTQSQAAVNPISGGLINVLNDNSGWICADTESYANRESPCSLSLAQTKASNWTVLDYPIEYCLSQPKDELCTLEFSVVIMIVVIVATAIKATAMVLTVISFGQESPLVTFGDAAASYLEHPDHTTEGLCLCDDIRPSWPEVAPSNLRDPKKLRSPTANFEFQTVDRSPRSFVKPRSFWFRSASPYQWVATFTLCIVALIVCGLLLRMSINAMTSSGETTFAYLWSLGFGTINTNYLIGWLDEPGEYDFNRPILSMTLIANTPQLILSLLYFLYNALYTSMLSENEWQRYSDQRRPLRVTTPTGQQRCSYFLSLPYRYAISLMVISALLHWLVSQSIFLVRVAIVDQHDVSVLGEAVSTCGWSSIAIVFVIVVGASIVVITFGIGFRRFKGYMPVARGSSIAISAACHPHELDKKASVLPVQWGATDEEEPGHCTLTSRFVFEPVVGRLYA